VTESQAAHASLQVLAKKTELTALQQALVATDGMVNQQVYVMAFNDVFHLCSLICLGVLVLVFLLPRNGLGTATWRCIEDGLIAFHCGELRSAARSRRWPRRCSQ